MAALPSPTQVHGDFDDFDKDVTFVRDSRLPYEFPSVWFRRDSR